MHECTAVPSLCIMKGPYHLALEGLILRPIKLSILAGCGYGPGSFFPINPETLWQTFFFIFISHLCIPSVYRGGRLPEKKTLGKLWPKSGTVYSRPSKGLGQNSPWKCFTRTYFPCYIIFNVNMKKSFLLGFSSIKSMKSYIKIIGILMC